MAAAVAAPLQEITLNDKLYVSQNAPKRIKSLQFSPLSPQEIVNLSEFESIFRELYQIGPDGVKAPQKDGVLDARLGTSMKSGSCETCHQPMTECVGHYSYIKLALPVYHIGYFRAVIQVLQDVCKTCARVLLSEEDRRKYLRSFRRPNLENMQRQALAKAVNSLCRKCLKCPYCGALNGTVKKATGALKITHERFRSKTASVRDEYDEFRAKFKGAIRDMRELPGLLPKAHEDIHPLRCLDLFKKISAEDCELLGLKPALGRPEDYIWQYISVPPPCIRPSVAQEGATNEDDLTVKLTEIIWANQLISAALQTGKGIQLMMEQWEFLQLSIALYINSETPGVPSAPGQKPIRGFCQRLKGKQGRFRGNLSGKRVDFSGRTVIGPDPNLRIDEVAIPKRVARKLTYPEKVTDYNITRLRQSVLNGTMLHPGANYIVDGVKGYKKFLKYANLADSAKYLKVGDTVERHLIDGDIVLFNRQPSLHKLSIMCHRVKVRPWRTFRLNECACNPYNADFDGDEMNLHVPQTEEARSEALELMSVKKNIVTPRNGEPIIAAIQDFITASFLLSRRDTLLNRQQFTQACSYLADANQQINLPPPTIWKPERLWTGKQVYNILMRPNKQSKVLVNLEAKCRTLEFPPKEYGYPPDMAPNDGYLVIVNSEIMCGVFDKNTVGDGKKNSVFGVILRDYGPDEASKAMNRLAKVSARWLANQGFSLGINDVIPGKMLRSQKEDMVEEAYAKCDENIALAKIGKLDNQPGCDQEATLEVLISGLLSGVRAAVGEICMSELSRANAPLVMATCGSKGSKINVAQMVACVGQQIIAGSRVRDGFQDRTLPHFPKKNREPRSRGFVRNSFFSGLTPTEFLFHAISGREGLVDTAVKTAETGYMQRRLMKALEDLSAHYDLSVRSASGGIVQFSYGDDTLDPACLEGDATPVEYVRTWSHSLAIRSRAGRGLMPCEIMELADEVINTPGREWERDCHPQYRKATMEFLGSKIVKTMADYREQLGLERGDAPENIEHGDALDLGADPGALRAVENRCKVTEEQLLGFLHDCHERYLRAKIEPGSTVGAVGAQSIGEPGTQMTLKTFHFAGVAAMNVTLGVPRIKEIINAAKVISTPIITCELAIPESEPAARIVKGRVEKTLLGDIASVVEEAWGDMTTSIGIHIDFRALQKLQLELTLEEIKWAIIRAPKLKITEQQVAITPRNNRLRIYVEDDGKSSGKYFRLRMLKRALPSIVVKGLPTIARALISAKEDKPKEKQLLVEGYGLKEVMTIDGIVGTKTRSNHVMDMAKVLGIEAARRTIYDEIQHTMKSHGMSIDPRHVMLLGDVMTYKGEVLGITRFGVAKMKDSVLMLASFEKTTDHLFDAALYSKEDAIEGVSECIIMGNPAANCGTSMASLVVEAPSLPPPKSLLFETAYKQGRKKHRA